ncbi:hypothetical protein MTR67_049574 [Solanum verrucosum]|uniref:Uncharacterized protein n=1 Tax=Solanum verrucosum TaxID=315347 RepID=A0AAF0V2W4_SOLVR|nr:hypothetical protein MTR67_049574 [Solanum verrucosum]
MRYPYCLQGTRQNAKRKGGHLEILNSIREQRFSGNFPVNFGQFLIERSLSLGNSTLPSTCHFFHSGISSNSSFSRDLKGFLENKLP